MTNNVEDLLREGIDRLAANADAAPKADAAANADAGPSANAAPNASADSNAGVPMTLLRRARQHNRRRRQAITGAIAAGTAAVTAAAVIIATAGTGGSNAGALHGQTITYVATRAEQALAQLNPAQAIEFDTLTARGGNFGFTVMNTAFNGTTGSTAQLPGVLSGVHASSEVDWTYDGLYLQHGYSAAGKLVYTVTTSAQGYSGAAYPARIRWHNPLTGQPGSPPGGNPTLTCDNAGTDFPSWKASITKGLSCHLFSLGGNQMIAGVNTIKLIGQPVTAEGETFRQTLWVDPKSYLPLRTSTTFTQGHRTGTLTHDFRWLSPTKANLARLHEATERGAIPASFRALPSTDLPLPGFDGPSS
ncbi:MAG TPA: hypothetical protein VGI00_21720 [Streptosporangiaceae bacterium]|jgi:hypothetical protein